MSVLGAGTLTSEPGLRFWLRHAEREGALVEERSDRALLLLPEHLSSAYELPEDLVVTADPDLAREEGAELLTAGHPALQAAAEAVLRAGDAGVLELSWPASPPPGRAVLQGEVRRQLSVAHGRVDVVGEPRGVLLPMLRAGAMLSCEASLAHRSGEPEEVWVYADSGLLPSQTVVRSLERVERRSDGGHRHLALPCDLERALSAVESELEARAAVRMASLALQAQRALLSELKQVDAYYTAALESIDRRMRSADPDRRRTLQSQAQLVRREHERRRAEVEQECRPSHRIAPFRLHVILVPAYLLPIEIRRGERRFPLSLTWLAHAGELAPQLCPHCGEAASLAVGKQRLGCTSCMQMSSSGTIAVGAAAPGGVANGSEDDAARLEAPARYAANESYVRRPDQQARAASRADGPAPPAGGLHPAADLAGPAAPRPAPPRPRPAPPGRRPVAPGRRPVAPGGGAAAIERVGNKLALALWQGLASGERWPRKRLQPDSPMLALFRLYGQSAPLCALGLPVGARPSEVTAATRPSDEEARSRQVRGAAAASARPSRSGGADPSSRLHFTMGEIVLGDLVYPYSMFWSDAQPGAPVIAELMPTPHPLVLPSRGEAAAQRSLRLHQGAPPVKIALDEVGTLLWQTELASSGLPLAARCLATWWRFERAADSLLSRLATEDLAPGPALAAAVAGAVERAAGASFRRRDISSDYHVDRELVKLTSQRLRSQLRIDRDLGW